MNLYIVESPLQLLCAYESLSENNQPYTLVLRITGRGDNDKHLLNCAELLGVDYKKIIIRADRAKYDFLINISNIIGLCSRKYEKIFFGSYYSKILKILKIFLKSREKYYLDDGLATLRAQRDILLKKRKKVNWYTFFQIESLCGQKIINHSFDNVKKKLTYSKSQGSYFIGQPFHLMKGFTKEDYIVAVKSAIELCGEDFLFYIPHRVEDVSVIEKLNKIKIIKLDVPVELYFINLNMMPVDIYSCYSTALITLNSLLSNVNVMSFRPKQKKTVFDEISVVYRYFEKIKIKIIEF